MPGGRADQQQQPETIIDRHQQQAPQHHQQALRGHVPAYRGRGKTRSPARYARTRGLPAMESISTADEAFMASWYAAQDSGEHDANAPIPVNDIRPEQGTSAAPDPASDGSVDGSRPRKRPRPDLRKHPVSDAWTVPDGTVRTGDADGAGLLDQLHQALTRYVVFPSPETADAVTLWIAATHAQTAWEHAPRLAVVSPEKRCGKSRLLDIAEGTCHRSIVTVNISPAALVRTVDEDDPHTLFIDEADTIFGPKAGDHNEDLRGIVNSGHQRGRPYIRYDIKTRRNEELPTFCMAMLAGIGDLPDTIMDRSIVVRMRRRAPGEQVDPYRTRRDRGGLHDLRDRLHAWTTAHTKELTDAVPVMPIEDRAADTWEPLVAIADLAGGHWPRRARTAALLAVTAESTTDTEASIGVRLLADTRDVLSDYTGGFMPSKDLVARLRKIDDAPWTDRDLTTRRLAMYLRPYGIVPGLNPDRTIRGYPVSAFTDAIARYLPPGSVQASEQPADQGEARTVRADGTVRGTVRAAPVF